jgi:hypothetical protein
VNVTGNRWCICAWHSYEGARNEALGLLDIRPADDPRMPAVGDVADIFWGRQMTLLALIFAWRGYPARPGPMLMAALACDVGLTLWGMA